jgi:hypothetical protein
MRMGEYSWKSVMEEKMKAAKIVFTTFTIACLMIIYSCGENTTSIETEPPGAEADDYSVRVEERGEEYLSERIENRVAYPLFSQVILEKGYRVFPSEASSFSVTDNESGVVSDVTMIPCRIPDDDSRIAMIYYVENEDEYLVSSAEYFEVEGFEISHPIDEEVEALMRENGIVYPWKMPMDGDESVSAKYWKCVGNHSVAGCLGCALRCYLTGPGFGTCVSICCSAAVVVSLTACAFTVYGW